MSNELNQSTEQANIKRGRGRPKGSNCFAHVKIKDLLNMLSEEAAIPVSQLWLRDTLGLIVSAPEIKVITSHAPSITIQDSTTEEKIEYSLNTFED